MLPSAQRLRHRGEFTAAVRAGRRAGRGSIVVHLSVPTSTEGADRPARVGFVVPKAVGGAVVRNLVRRRLRHLMRERLADLPTGAMLVVRALPEAAGTPYSRLGMELDAALAAARAPGRSRTGVGG